MTRRSDRLDLLLAHRPKHGLLVEVAPYFNPALPKAKGNDVLILDVFDTDQLREFARKDRFIPSERIGEIEAVDIVGDASQIGELLTDKGLAGKVGFVVSSHNFEHLPNPIRFLQGVESILMPGGILSMAIPDCRATFDHFRSLTRLVDWLVAYQDGHKQPTAETLFDLQANEARFSSAPDGPGSCDWHKHDPRDVWLGGNLRLAYDRWLSARKGTAEYRDAHVSVVFDAQFTLLIEDLRNLGLIGLEIVEITENYGHEFFAHFRRPVSTVTTETDEDYRLRREDLMRKVIAGMGASAFPVSQAGWRRYLKPKRLMRRVIGADRYDRMRAWNRARIGRNS